MYQEKIKEAEKSMQQSINFLKVELSKVKTGRANTELVSGLRVECYGVMTPLQQLATINVPEPQMIVIKPYDRNILSAIEKSMQTSDLGLNPTNDGNILRIAVPPLTEERRKEIVSLMNQKLEETRISLRTIREKCWKEIKILEDNSSITEDDKYKSQEELNEVIDKYNKKVEEIGNKKESEIMSI
jgi:ribosome recycling factor